MSDMSPPAGNPGGDTTTSIAAALADLPARIRVHALAKLLGRSSREVLAAVTDLGADGRSVQSSIDRELALRVAEALGVTASEPAEPQAEAPATDPRAPGFQPTARRVAGSPGFSEPAPASHARAADRSTPPTPVFASASPLFLPPEPTAPPARPARPKEEPAPAPEPVEDEATEETEEAFAEDTDEGRPRRRRGRRGRGRGKGGQDDGAADEGPEDEVKPDKPEKSDKPDRKAKAEPEAEDADEQESADGDDPASRRRRRRRRRRGGDGEDGNATEDDPPNTVVHVREAREDKEKPESDGRDEVRSVRGSTRLEAKRQRRRDGREAGRRRAPILSEAEFLARREAVDRAMVIRERGDRIQIGVLEDGVLVEHFVTSAGSGSLVGNVYLGRVQNVLPSMEAAFVDIGRGRNAVLYAGEVDWDAAGLEGKARKIEQALSTGDSVLVQVTKDPVGHKGARLTTQISLPGRFLVYVPGGGATGISRKLPENERRRLKDVLKRVVPEDAGVIIRTASEGISEEELARDVRRLQAQWQVIKDKTEGTNGTRKVGAPSLVYEEPDLLVKVVRDLFTEDFSALVVQGDIAWETVDAYVRHVAPELSDRLRKHVSNSDVFAEYRIDEQLLKALDRKVWLPSGGYLVIDRTEAMTVIDVNTGKFTGSGGNLEETVTRNNLESAEEIVRQLRLRDIGGIIVIDFIDMVLESNRDLVLRRLTECLGRDRTRHQVAEVTSLGLVQMTRKRVGTGLLEAFGTTCEHCKGRGVVVSTEPVSKPNGTNGHTEQPARGNTRRSRGRDESKPQNNKDAAKEAAAQAAKDAVRDIAKAITKATDHKPSDEEPTQDSAAQEAAAQDATAHDSAAHDPAAHDPAARDSAARVSAAQDTAARDSAARDAADQDAAPQDAAAQGAGAHEAAAAPTRGETRHRTRVRRRSESRNGTSPHTPEPTEAPAAAAEAPAERPEGAGDPSEPAASSEPSREQTNGSITHTTPPTTWGTHAEWTPQATSADSGEPATESANGPSTHAEPTPGTEAESTHGVPGTEAEPAYSTQAGSIQGPGTEAESTHGVAGTQTEPTQGTSGTQAEPVHGDLGAPGGSPGHSEPSESTPQAADAQATPADATPSSESPEDEPTGWTAPGDSTESTWTARSPWSAPAGSGEPVTQAEPSGFTTPSEAAGTASPEPTGSASEPSASEPPADDETTPSVPAPATPPRRQPRRAASRPAGPPVSARHDG